MSEGRTSQWDVQVALTRYRELLSEAEAERLARRAPRQRRSLFQALWAKAEEKEDDMKLRNMLRRNRARSEVVPGALTSQSTLAEALGLIKETGALALPVIDEGRYRGVVLRDDLLIYAPSPATSLSKWELSYLLEKVSIENLIKQIPTVEFGARLDEVVRAMRAEENPTVAVISQGQLYQLISWRDVIREIGIICDTLRAVSVERELLPQLNPRLS